MTRGRRTAFAIAIAIVTVLAGCDRPGLKPVPVPGRTIETSLAPNVSSLEQLTPSRPEMIVVTTGGAVTDASLVVFVRGIKPIRLVEVRPDIDTSPRTPVNVIGTEIRAVSPTGASEMIGVRAGFPPEINPYELAPAANTPLYPREAQRLAYEIVLGLSVSNGPAHVRAVIITYEIDGDRHTVSFPHDLTMCIAEGNPAFGETMWSKGCQGSAGVRKG